jgi:hypothetical protein
MPVIRRWLLTGLPIIGGISLLVVCGLRPGRVEVDPARRARVPEAPAPARVETPVSAARKEAPVPADPTVKARSTALEVLGPGVPYATSRAVNSWFDYESVISDLSGSREFLGDETYRREVIRVTAEFLELAPARVPAFDATLRVVQTDLRRIQRDMGRLLAAAPVDLSDAELRRLQSDAEGRYRSERESTLARFDSFLDDSRNRHREFRNYLERWVTRCCGLDP